MDTPKFCSIDEYNRHLPEKLAFEQVEQGETYVLLGRVDGPEREAVKATAFLIGKIATADSQDVVMLFGDKKSSIQIFEKYFAYNQSGFLVPKTGEFSILDHRYDTTRNVTRSYLRNRKRESFGPTMEQKSSKELVLT